MTKKLSEFDAKKLELNCGVNVIPLLNYFEEVVGYKRMVENTESVGLPISFLKIKSNWVSYEYYNRLLEKLVETTGDENAPFKIAFSMGKPQSIFRDVRYAALATVFLGSPKLMYKAIITKSFYETFTKVGDFEYISSTSNSITVKLKMKEGFEQTKYNCLSIQGYFSFGSVSCGYPPAEVDHSECILDGKESCIYKITWEKRTRWLRLFSIFILFTLIGINAFFFSMQKFFIKDIILSFLSYSFLLLLIKAFQLKNKIRFIEVFNYERNNSVLDAMAKIEKDYNEILETKIKIEARNRYLTIVNNINKSILEENVFDSLTKKVCEVLINDIGFIECLYFQIDLKENIFNLQVHTSKNKLKNKDNEDLNFNISINEYFKIEELGFAVNYGKFNELIDFDSADIKNWFEKRKNKNIYFIPVEVPNIYIGFYILLADKKLEISHDLIDMLLQNISGQLKVAYLKIYSKYVIENILSSIPSIVLIFTVEDYEIKYINDMFFSSYPNSYSIKDKSEIIGKSLFSVLSFDEEAVKNVDRIIYDLLIGKKTDIYEINVGPMVFEYSLFTIPQYMEGRGDPLVGIILTDVTEAKYFQQKLLINEKLLALGRVASGIAHEINNPLYGVLANAEEIAYNESLDEETKKSAEEMIEHIMHVSDIIRDLSSYSKTLRKETLSNVDINEVIEESLTLVSQSSIVSFISVVIDSPL